LIKLSDEYLALAPGVERGKFLLDKFGKSGMDMARVMDLGGAAIADMNGKVEGNLVLTDDAIKQSEEYRMNVDALNDAWLGFKVRIGNAVIPVLNDMISTQMKWNDAMKQAAIDTESTNPYVIKHAAALAMMKEKSEGTLAAVDNTTLGYMKQAAGVEALAEYYRKLNPEIVLTEQEQKELDKALLKAEESMQKQRKTGLDLAMDLTAADKDYAKSQADITAEIAKLTDEKSKLYKWEVSDIKSVQDKIDELSGRYDENAVKHSERTQKILLDMTLEKIAMQDGIAGFSEAEAARALAVAETAGAVEGAAIREAVAMDQISSAMADPTQKLLDMKAILDSMVANNWNINVAVLMQGVENLQKMTGIIQPGRGGSSRVQQRAGGGGVNANEMYIVGENGPELFMSGSNGQIIPSTRGGVGGGNMIFNLSLNSAVSVLDETRAKQVLYPFVEAISARLKQEGKLS
jgi:hypothetical protein